jgi:AraC family transcriptional regulator
VRSFLEHCAMETEVRIVSPAHLGRLKPFRAEQSVLDFSSFNQLDKQLVLQGYAIKYVFDGTENYKISKHFYAVRRNQYLLVAPNPQIRGFVDSPTPVKGVCVSLAPQLMENVMATLYQPQAAFPDPIVDPMAYLQEVHWVRHRPTQLGAIMSKIGERVNGHLEEVHTIQDGFFFQLAELYLSDYQHFARQLSAIGATKLSTATDLHRRLMVGRDFMEDCFLQSIGVRDVAKEATMSEYQFYRLFKSVMGVSPYQYLLEKRLQYAYQMLQNERGNVTEVALMTGFADVFSFSKAFKKRFCTNPTSVLFRTK